LHADDDRDRPPIAGNNDRSAFTGFQESAELRLYLRDRRNLHSCTSSPPMIRRSFCFSPMAMIWTIRASSSMSYKTRNRLSGPMPPRGGEGRGRPQGLAFGRRGGWLKAEFLANLLGDGGVVFRVDCPQVLRHLRGEGQGMGLPPRHDDYNYDYLELTCQASPARSVHRVVRRYLRACKNLRTSSVSKAAHDDVALHGNSDRQPTNP